MGIKKDIGRFISSVLMLSTERKKAFLKNCSAPLVKYDFTEDAEHLKIHFNYYYWYIPDEKGVFCKHYLMLPSNQIYIRSVLRSLPITTFRSFKDVYEQSKSTWKPTSLRLHQELLDHFNYSCGCATQQIFSGHY